MTTEEISQEVSKLAKESFDQYGIPEELRPKIEIVKKMPKLAVDITHRNTLLK